jgi:hypothetical protein
MLLNGSLFEVLAWRVEAMREASELRASRWHGSHCVSLSKRRSTTGALARCKPLALEGNLKRSACGVAPPWRVASSEMCY